ncbi:hypothetical protein VOLCADRAFT_82885 [Volvox carteri f. nagariensis]|uniref:serine C-palmitoyltransferase n=1 Tax=Volvox carteri f. nagariensis TaxID=3068 RepID=D8U7K5_VOLCA|nr:uncharacterized protein VOLCADRAFT_82885 [Volvox carteri f. nagariensis]EFJ44316.1 hypothetical protein VOLCADRAFT_82885 [Volvox carteri f. nagariensis]|eukprot:XP_002954675.1 hypothetical protein VOLCADRAFT_82885 [Volvox carteri f. nagariensis]
MLRPRRVLAGLALATLAYVALAGLLAGAHAAAAFEGFHNVNLLSPSGIVHAFRAFWDIVGPGGKLHPAYFLEHKGHLVIEGVLILAIVYLALQHSFKVQRRAEGPLTEKEIEQLCREWTPEPLVPTLAGVEEPPQPQVITGLDGPYVYLKGRKDKVVNMASSNYLNMANNKENKKDSIETVDTYGVGSCGPRGFYGTIDKHLDLEKELADYYGTEAAIIYSYDVATIASIIPAFANRKDIIVCDEYCSYPIQAGCTVSRAKVATFKHNDMDDLTRVIEKLEAEEKAKRKPLCRKLIVVEGIYANYGDVAQLKSIWEIKNKYKYRLMVDESHAFGVLGATGRGASEHFGLKPGQVEIIVASMSHAMGSVGGFCVGDRDIVEHQRLSGSGYCFSASLPPYLAVAGSTMLKLLKPDKTGSSPGKELMSLLQKRIKSLREQLFGGATLPSPVLHLHLAKPSGNASEDLSTLVHVADHMLVNGGVLVGVSQYSMLDIHQPPPSLVMFANVGLGEKEILIVVAALRKAVKDVIKA